MRLATAALTAALTLPLLVYASIGSFARYTADDYCWAGVLREQGFLNAQAWWYVAYSPRYAFTFIVNLVELLGPGIVPILPGVALVVWVAALTWALVQLGVRLPWLLALVIAVATLQTAPDLPQSLYWQTGMLTYLLPLILATVLIGAIAHLARAGTIKAGWLVGCAALTFVAGGLSETYLIPQNVALTLAELASVFLWIRSRSNSGSAARAEHDVRGREDAKAVAQASAARAERDIRGREDAEAVAQASTTRDDAEAVAQASTTRDDAEAVAQASTTRDDAEAVAQASTRREGAKIVAIGCAAALVGGVLALLTIVLAPATTVRVGYAPADFWLASSAAIATGAFQVARLVRYFLPTLAVCVAVPLLLGGRNKPMRWQAVAVVTAVVAVVVPFCYFPSFYASNGNPPARSLIVPGVVLIAYAVFVGYAVRVQVPRQVAIAGLIACALVPVGIAALSLPERAQAAQYAALWDAEDQYILSAREQGATDLVVPPLPKNLGESFVGPDPTDWFNNCVARYYSLRTIATSS